MTNSSSEIQLIPYSEAYEEGFEDMPRRMSSETALNLAALPMSVM